MTTAALLRSARTRPAQPRGPGLFITTIENSSTYDAFPTITEAANHDLIVCARRGAGHLSGDGDIVLWSSSDGADTWSASSVIFDHTTEAYDLRDPGIHTLSDGTLLLTVHLNSTTGSADITHGCGWALSSDNGATWSSLAVLADAFTNFSAQCGRVLQLPNGDLLWAIYGSDSGGGTNRYVKVYRSTDVGSSWSYLADIGSAGDGQMYAEANLFSASDGTLVALIRNDTDAALYRATSSDSGATWTSPASVLADVDSGPQGAYLADGSLAVGLSYYPSGAGGGSDGGNLLGSSDDGATWTKGLRLTSLSMQYASITRYGSDQALLAFSNQNSSSDADIHLARLVGIRAA